MRGRSIAITAAAALLAATVATAQPAPSSDKADALSAAARKGDAAAVKALLDEGVDVNTKYRYGVTVAHLRVRSRPPRRRQAAPGSRRGRERQGHVLRRDAAGAGGEPGTEEEAHAHRDCEAAAGARRRPQGRGADERRVGSRRGHDEGDPRILAGFSDKTLSAALESATNDKQTEIVALLEHAGAKPRAGSSIDPAQLARYAGTYRNPAGNELVFTIKDGKLTGGPAAQSFTLAASDSKSFRIVGAQGVTLTFLTEGDKPDGKVTGLALTQGGSTTNYTRVEGK